MSGSVQPRVRVECGDALDLLRQEASESVDCVVTSPPYWGLRDYGTAQWEGGDPGCGHGVRHFDGPKQTGASQSGHASAADRLGRLVCQRCGAVRVDRQIGLEETPEAYVARLGEVFREVRRVLRESGTLWLNLGDTFAAAWSCSRRNIVGNGSMPGGREGRPNRMSGSLKNKDLVGIPWRVAFALQADGWWLRSDIVWSKPNPMPESVTDRPTRAHEYVFLLTKAARYWYDADAIAEDAIHAGRVVSYDGTQKTTGHENRTYPGAKPRDITVNRRRNARSVWNIATQPFPEAHFATFPEELAQRCLLAGCPEGGTVLDPFGGSGTVGAVAARFNRNAILFELNPDYCAMARRRVLPDAQPRMDLEAVRP